jgi:hypothetical protein
MSDITDRQNGDDIEIARRDVRERVTDIVYTNSEAADGEVLQWNSTASAFQSVTPNSAGLYIEGGTDLPVTDGGTGASTASAARTNLGIGTIATQDANAVAITGGTVSGVTLSSSAATITGGTVSGVTLSSSAATITGGSVTGITDLAVADGGTGVSTLTGIVKGNGTSAFSAASAGTDYYAPGSTDVAVADGGTGLSSATAYAVLCGGTTSTGAFQSIASVGTSGHVLTSNGAGALPTFQAAPTYPGQYYDLISSQTASNSAQIDFTSLSSSYQDYIVILTDIVPVSDSYLYLRCSTDNGSSFDSTSDIYELVYRSVEDGSQAAGGVNVNATEIRLNYNRVLDAGSNSNYFGIVRISNPSQSSVYKEISCIGAMCEATAPVYAGSNRTSGIYKSTTAVNAIRFYMGTGNISSGTFTLYGVKKS